MLHASTLVLTPTGFVSVSSVRIDDTLKTYFGRARVNKIEQATTDLMKVAVGGAEILCSTDQKFLRKADTGYVFGTPSTGCDLVKYSVNAASEDMLMTLQTVDYVTLWGKGNFYRIHLDDDFLLIITNYLVVRA